MIDSLGPGRLLHPAPRPAGARARGGGRGARARRRRARCCRPGAGAARRCPRSSATSPASRTSTRSPTSCSSAASSTRSSTSLPDIDLDFPRDIREVLIPRVHDRYGREHSALVAAFPTFRSRGAIRELGKVLGLPPGELERVARGAEPWAVRGVAHDVEAALGLEHGGPPGAERPRQSRAVRDVDRRVAGDGQRARSGRPRGAHPDETRFAALPGRWSWLAAAVRRGATGCRATCPSTRAG